MLLRNAIRCNLCGDIIQSRDRHDFQRCRCKACFVDGGLDLIRHGGNPDNYTDLSQLPKEEFRALAQNRPNRSQQGERLRKTEYR